MNNPKKLDVILSVAIVAAIIFFGTAITVLLTTQRPSTQATNDSSDQNIDESSEEYRAMYLEYLNNGGGL